jgi:transcriptional regulator with XRE-family HTH domain
MSEYQYLAVNLRRFRTELRLSQAEVGKRAGRSQWYVSHLERGLRPSDPADVGRLASALGVSEAALLRRVRRLVPVAA